MKCRLLNGALEQKERMFKGHMIRVRFLVAAIKMHFIGFPIVRNGKKLHITMEISGCMILFYQMPIVLVLNLAGIALSPILRKLDFLRGLMVHLINKAMPQNGLKIQQQIAFGNLLWVAALFDRKNMHIVE